MKPKVRTQMSSLTFFSKKRPRWRDLLADERGVTFLEFAIVALPLLALIFGILEVGFIFWGGYELDNATLSAARLIRTGQAQTQNLDQTAIKTNICGNVALLFDCQSKLQVDVENYPNFANVTASSPLDANGNLKTSFPYSPGGPSQVVLVTAYYEWPLINFSSVALLSNLASGNRLLQSTAIFRSEPFPAP